MMNFTVEVNTAPVTDWAILRAVLDAVPGSLLLEDPEAPQLIIPVDSESATKAVTFVDGLSQLMGFTPVSGRVYETPEVDFDEPEGELSEPPVTSVSMAVVGWMNTIPSVPPRRRHRMARA